MDEKITPESGPKSPTSIQAMCLKPAYNCKDNTISETVQLLSKLRIPILPPKKEFIFKPSHFIYLFF